MDKLSLSNPLFATYVIAAAIMIIKVKAMSWLTVARMMQIKGGFRSPEDAKRSPLNPIADPSQVDKNEHVERIRRIHLNDLENVPFFLAAGFLFILTNPSLLLAQVLLYGYVITRLLHFLAYVTAQLHDVRAAMWTPGSLAILYMAGHCLVAAVRAA